MNVYSEIDLLKQGILRHIWRKTPVILDRDREGDRESH